MNKVNTASKPNRRLDGTGVSRRIMKPNSVAYTNSDLNDKGAVRQCHIPILLNLPGFQSDP
jgi:hypothetical protein